MIASISLDRAVLEADAVSLELLTFGFATASPEPSRSSSSLETVGWASRNLWLGWGRPKSSMRPEARCGQGRAIRRCSLERQARVDSSPACPIGRPEKYFGITQAPLRVERKTFSATPLRDSSETMSTALLPMPTTSTRLPIRSSGSVGPM